MPGCTQTWPTSTGFLGNKLTLSASLEKKNYKQILLRGDEFKDWTVLDRGKDHENGRLKMPHVLFPIELSRHMIHCYIGAQTMQGSAKKMSAHKCSPYLQLRVFVHTPNAGQVAPAADHPKEEACSTSMAKNISHWQTQRKPISQITKLLQGEHWPSTTLGTFSEVLLPRASYNEKNQV